MSRRFKGENLFFTGGTGSVRRRDDLPRWWRLRGPRRIPSAAKFVPGRLFRRCLRTAYQPSRPSLLGEFRGKLVDLSTATARGGKGRLESSRGGESRRGWPVADAGKTG